MMVDDKSISLKDVVKNKITTVLTETGFSDKRAGKLDQTDFKIVIRISSSRYSFCIKINIEIQQLLLHRINDIYL